MTTAFAAACTFLWKTTVLATLVALVRRDHLRGTRSVQVLLLLVLSLVAATYAVPVARVPVPGLVLAQPPGWVLISVFLIAFVVGSGLLLRMAIDLRRLTVVARGGSLVTVGPWREALDALESSRVRGRDLPLIAADIDAPLTWGWRRPAIMIPVTLVGGSPLPGVLRHEVEHVARRDWPKLITARIAVAFFFWLPATWILLRWMESESESSCDAAAVDAGIPAEDYGREILECAGGAKVHTYAVSMVGRRSLLARRLMVVLDRVAPGRRPRLATMMGLVVVALILAPLRFGAPALAVSSPASGESPREASARLLRISGDASLKKIAAAIERRDFSLRHSGCGTLDSPAAFGPLALATLDADPEVRRLGVWGLGEMRYPTALPVILPRLDDPSSVVREEACLALADMPFVPVTAPLVRRLEDPAARVRRAAAHALGDRRDSTARGPLESCLDDSDPSVRAVARWALAQL